MANPIAAILTQLRYAVIDSDGADRRRRPSAAAGWLLIPLAVVAARLRSGPLGVHARGATHRRGPLMGDAPTREAAELEALRVAHRRARARAPRADRAGQRGAGGGAGPELLARPLERRPERAHAQARRARAARGACAPLARSTGSSTTRGTAPVSSATRVARRAARRGGPRARPRPTRLRSRGRSRRTRSTAAPVTELLYARLDEHDVAAIERAARAQGGGAARTGRSQRSQAPHARLRGAPLGGATLERTGLSAAMPGPGVHSMAQGPLAAGGSTYYADLVVDSLRQSGHEVSAGQAGLDFGCSSGRVVRVLAARLPASVEWHGCDPIPDAIEWARANLPGIAFERSPERPPLPYEDGQLRLRLRHLDLEPLRRGAPRSTGCARCAASSGPAGGCCSRRTATRRSRTPTATGVRSLEPARGGARRALPSTASGTPPSSARPATTAWRTPTGARPS